jgi:hypothetical protein
MEKKLAVKVGTGILIKLDDENGINKKAMAVQ